MKRQEPPRARGRSRRRARFSRTRTSIRVLFAALVLAVVVMAYLLDFERIRMDLRRWLASVDQTRTPTSELRTAPDRRPVM